MVRVVEGPQLSVAYADAEGLLHDYDTNLVHGRTFVITERSFTIGQELALELSFPGLVTPLVLPARVRWCEDGSNATAPGVGLEVDLGDFAARDRVTRFIERIAANDPTLVTPTMRVLVVEDNPHLASLICDGLRAAAKRSHAHVHFELSVAGDGREALELLSHGNIDLLIIDVYLPVLDGTAVIRELRRAETLHSLPVVAVSAGGPAARAAAVAAGADHFLDKPMRLADIMNTIRLIRVAPAA